MRSDDFFRGLERPARRNERAERLALWILLAAGLLLMLFAARTAGAEETATRVDRFASPLQAGATVRVENVSGDVTAVSGRAFSAVVTTTVSAADEKRAEQILRTVAIRGNRDDDAFSLVAEWPGARGRRSRATPRSAYSRCDCRINARFEIVVPPGVAAELETVNGRIRVADLDGDLKLTNVNGEIEIGGARRSLAAQTVNGRILATARALPSGADWELETVNGPILVTLPKNARFALTGSTLSGAIASTFALPPSRETEADDAAAVVVAPKEREIRRSRVRERTGRDEAEVLIDGERLERQIEESLRDAEAQLRASGRKLEFAMREIRIPVLGAHYAGEIGSGGPKVAASTLNGNITVLAEGTREADARTLATGRRSIAIALDGTPVKLPRMKVIHVAPQAAPQQPRAPEPPSLLELDDEEIVRGDVNGDFVSSGGGNYRIGKVSGRVKIVTRAGEVHVASSGRSADVRTLGGDVRLGAIGGDLRARTLAGDVVVTSVAGAAWVDTSGGDVRIGRIGGAAEARTGGGDIRLPAVAGAVQAVTGGGEVQVGVLAREVRGIVVHNAGGDVLLTLPANFRGDFDLEIEGADPDSARIRSEFPEVAVSRSGETERGAGSVNGGGSRVLVRTSSGSIRIRKGAPAS